MGQLREIKNHIPSKLLEGNVNLKGLIAIIEQLNIVKGVEIDRFRKLQLYPLITELDQLKRRLQDYNIDYLVEPNVGLLNCLYQNKQSIFMGKGGERSFKLLIGCYLPDKIGKLEVDGLYNGTPLILSDEDRFYDQLPDWEEIQKDVDNTGFYKAYITPRLHGSTWYLTQKKVVVNELEPDVLTLEDQQLITDLAKTFLPMIDVDLFFGLFRES